MKFYKLVDYYIEPKFVIQKQTFICQIYYNDRFVCNLSFYKNAKKHNIKNIAFYEIIEFNCKYIYYNKFYYNGICYGDPSIFTKELWRKFVRELKLQAFL